jgi:hypothetical protein
MKRTANDWLRRIFSVTTLVSISTIVSACIGVIVYVQNNGGDFVAFINSKEVQPPIERNILVYIDKDSADLSQIGLFPHITNPSKYSLQDVLVTYRIDTHSADVAYSDYCSVHRLSTGEQADNIDKTLYSKSDMPEPFYSFVVKDSSYASINIRATYRGVDQPFTYNARVFAIKYSIDSNEDLKRHVFEDAVLFSKRKQRDVTDLYVLKNDSIISLADFSISDASARTEKIKTAKQICEDNKENSIYAQEQQSNPWYINAIGCILCLIVFICIAPSVFGILHYYDEDFRKYRSKKLLFISVFCAFIIYLSLYFLFKVWDDFSIKFFAGMFSYFIIYLCFVSLLVTSFKIDYRAQKSGKEDYGLIFAVVSTITLAYPIGFVCKYLYEIIPF